MCVHICVYIFVCTYLSVYIYVCVYISVCTYLCIYVCVHICVSVCVCVDDGGVRGGGPQDAPTAGGARGEDDQQRRALPSHCAGLHDGKPTCTHTHVSHIWQSCLHIDSSMTKVIILVIRHSVWTTHHLHDHEAYVGIKD